MKIRYLHKDTLQQEPERHATYKTHEREFTFMKKRFLSLFLAFVMIIGMLPMHTLTANAVNISTTSSTIQKGHYVYFGSSGQKWRVLDASKTSMGTNGMFLFSEDSLGIASIGPTGQDYSTNGLEAWCTNYYNGTNFTTAEKNVMLATTVAESTGTYANKSGTNYALNGDHLFLLSGAEVTNSAYFANDEARKLNHSDHDSKHWFLRTANNNGTLGQFARVSADAIVAWSVLKTDGSNGLKYSYRPGFNLDTSKILFVSAATGGKTDGLTAASTSGSEWKLTLKDNNSFANGASINKTSFCGGQSVTVTHKALSGISADYTNVTAAIYSGNTLLYYGSVNTNTSATSSTFTLPADLTVGNYTLKLYGEDWNGDKRTDIATGTPYSVNITVQDHSYQYSGSGKVITATCKNDCGYSETATITAEDKTYTGSAIKDAAKVDYSDGWKGGTLTPDYSDNTNKGTATATITIGEGTTAAIASTTFTINAANIGDATITLDPANGDYTGSAYTPSVSIVFNGETLDEDDYDISWDKTGFTNAETYTVRIVGANNFTGSVDKTFKISAANLSGVKVEQTGTLTYEPNKNLTPTVSENATAVNNQPVTFTYSLEQNGTYGDMPSFTEAGTYTVYFKATAPNHNEATGSFTVKINKAVVTVPTIKSKEYTGSTLTADIDDTDLYTVTKNEGGIDVLASGKGYDVLLTLKDTKNYKWSTTDNAAVTLPFVITAATNEWTDESAIENWTYGETAKAPEYTAKFGDVTVTYSGTANDGTNWNNSTAPTKAGEYKATFTVAATGNYSGLETTKTFTIFKANYAMSNAKWNYTSAFQYDGKEHTVTVTGLPDGVNVSGYIGNKGTAVDNYTAIATLSYDSYNYNEPTIANLDWKIVNGWNPKVNTEYTVSEPNSNGWLKEDLVITAKTGYVLSLTNTANGEWVNTLTGAVEGVDSSVNFYVKNTADGTISEMATANYKLDKVAPTGTVEFVERKAWQEFVNTITFGLFYDSEVTVKVSADDKLSGVDKIEYASADKAMTQSEVEKINDWTEYTDSFGVAYEEAKKFVYFVRITDKAGNVTYLSSDGAEYDNTDPVISGVENGKTYYTTQKVTVTDKNIDTVTVNNDDATAEITLDGNVKKTYTIVATDKAKNVTTFTVTMKPISDLSKPIDNVDTTNVNSSNEQAVDKVKADVAAVDTTNATDAETEALKAITDKATELEKVIDDTKAEIARITEEMAKYDDATVNSDDAAALEQLGKDIKVLTDKNNLTEAERTALTEDAADVAAMQKIVTDTTAENNRISDKVDDYDLATVTSDDKADLEQLLADINKQLESTNLTDEEKSELNGEKKAVEDLLTKIKGTDELIDKVTGDVDGYSDETVKSTDKDAIEQTIKDIDALLETENLTETEKKALEDTKAKAEGLLDTIAETVAENDRISDKVDDYNLATVTSDDKAELEQLLADINKQLESTNLTDEEKSELNGEKKAVEDLLTKIKGTDELIDKLTGDVDGYSDETVKSTDKDAIEQTIKDIDALLETENLTEDEEKALEDAKTKAQELLDTIKEAAESTDTENTEKVTDVTAENVTPEDKTDLEKAKEDLEKALEEHGSNMTDDEKKAVEDEIKRIDDALEVIGNVEKAEELIDKLPDTIKKDDADTIKAADDAYNALSDYEKSLVDEGAKEALDDAKAALAELNKPADSTSPNTGDNSNMFLWIALLFISGGAVITLTVVDRKKRIARK